MNYVTQQNGEVGSLNKDVTQVVSTDISLSGNDSGKILLIGTDAKTITLPSTQAGLVYTFVNIGADGNNIIKISPAAADGIAGTVTLASSVVALDGAVNKDAINTKATTKRGDSIKIVGTGVAGAGAWIVLSSTGIWAREA
jgi:hypothetical protein